MSYWIAAILAMLNRGACWQGSTGAHTERCTLY